MKITKALLEKLILEVIKDFDEEDLPPMQTADDPDPSMGRPLPKSIIRRGDVEKDPDKYPAQRDRMIKRFRDRQILMKWQEYYLPQIEKQYQISLDGGAKEILEQFFEVYRHVEDSVDLITDKIIDVRRSQGEIPPDDLGIEIDDALREKIFLGTFFYVFSSAKQNAKQNAFFSNRGGSDKLDLFKDVYQSMVEAFGINDPKSHSKKTREYPANPLAGTTTG